jgi:branched-chain amino acid transport system ATP-binding protein
MSDILLEVRQVTTGYGDLIIVRQASFTVQKKELVVLLGSNGAGKTSLIEAVVGLNKVKSGEISFDGQSIGGLPAHEIAVKGLILVPQGRRLFRKMTVEENLMMGSFAPALRKKRAELVEYVYGIFPRLKDRCKQVSGSMSGGEQQMLAIGRALMSDPKLLILDEPSLGLAPLLVEDVFNAIKIIRETRGIGVLLVEQNLVKALEVADRGYVLESGKIVVEGLPKELEHNDFVKRAYIGL